MKKTLLITLFIIALSNLSMVSEAQPYRPMAVDGAHWIVKTDNLIGFTTRLFEYYCSGDTVVNDIQYKKIYYRNLAATMDPPPFYPTSEYSLFAFLRDDTANRKVYAYTLELPLFGECAVLEDVLLYDFSVQPSQPINQCTLPSFYNGTLDNITIETWFGISTRVFYTNPMYFRYYEGIGSEFGLFEAMFIPVKGEDFEYPSLYYYCEDTPCEYVYPEITLLTVGQVFDFQPGDVFHAKDVSGIFPPNGDRVTITDRYNSSRSDTVFYVRSHNSYSSVVSWESGEPELVYTFGTFTDTVSYSNLQSPMSEYDAYLTDDYYVKNDSSLCATLINGYNLVVGPGFEDDNISREYGKGLGVTKAYLYSGTGGAVQYSEKLVYYHKNGTYCGEEDVTSTRDIAKSRQLMVYPNPAGDYLYFNLEPFTGTAPYTLYSIHGSAVISGQATQGHNRISTANLTPGIYQLRVSLNNGYLESRVVIAVSALR